MPKTAKVTCLNDYRPVALTSVAMKCFERLVMTRINTIIPETLDPLLSLNMSKTKELIVDYRKRRDEHAPIHMNRL